MARKVYAAFLLLLLILNLTVIAVWVHSHLVGWEQTWGDDAESEQGGRIVSSQGQLFFQRCDLAPPSFNADLFKDAKTVMPKDFLVGSNRAGEQTVIAIHGFQVPFARPGSGQFIGFSNHIGLGGGTLAVRDGKMEGHRWNASWDERVIAYWLVELVFLMILVLAGWKWVFGSRKHEPKESAAPAG